MTVGSRNSVLQMLNSKMRVILCDNKTYYGSLIAYDKYMNIVLKDCYELKKYKPKKKGEQTVKKTLGLVILRGENVASLVVDESETRSRDSSRSSSSRH